MPHNSSSKLVLDRIRAIIADLNDNSTLGIKNAQANRCLIILYVANIEPKYGYLGEKDETDKLRYFTVGDLKKVSNKKGTGYAIDFTGPRSAEPYGKCKIDGYVEIKEESGNRRSFALTEKGFKQSLEIIYSIYRGKYGESSATKETIDKDVAADEFLSYEEYIKRRDVKTLVKKYPSFIGRESELEMLDDFLNDPKRFILLITGNGGIGKTRLIIEFVKRMQENIGNETKFDIYFLNPYKETYPSSLTNKSLVIIDDAGRKTANLNHIIDLVLNSTGSKMILVERSIFKTRIENIIKDKKTEPVILCLDKGEIFRFLKQYFSSIDERVANDIEKECRCSFDYAAMCAEYYGSKGKISSLDNILSWKIESYMKDISERTKSDIADVKYIIHLFSMLLPIDWDRDKKYFEVEFPNLYGTMVNILYGARNMYEDSIILPEGHSTFLITPDPLADRAR